LSVLVDLILGKIPAPVNSSKIARAVDDSKAVALKVSFILILLESVDCLIMSLDILSHQGFSRKEIVDMANIQIEKWILNIKTKLNNQLMT
jgi:hypothetical protein